MAESCGHCGFRGTLEHKGNVVAKSSPDYHEQYGEVDVQTIWDLSMCPNCERPTLESYIWVDPVFDSPDDVNTERVYPTPLDNSALPTRVQAQADAALRVKAVEPSFYAVGIRRMLEAVCRDQGATGKTLEKQIDDLVSKSKLPQVFADMASQLRLLGNWGAHDAETQVLARDVPLIEEFADAILDYLYRAQAKVSAVEHALQTRLSRAKQRQN